MKKMCKVCGYSELNYYPWGEDGKTPSYEICPCCGVEFGYEDSTLEGMLKYRKKWIKLGGKWFKEEKRPNNWSLDKQLKNVCCK